MQTISFDNFFKDFPSLLRYLSGYSKSVLLLAMVFFLWAFEVSAQYQEYKITRITDQYGNSPGATFSILEDQSGFIWFGTLNGLKRYDGYGFKEFRYNENDKNSLSNDLIRAMHIDTNGIIWIGTQGGGLNRFDPRTERFIRFMHATGDDKSISSNDLWAIEEDKRGNLWLGTWDDGLIRFDKQTFEFTTYRFGTAENPGVEDAIRSIHADNQGELWIGTHSSGLIRMNILTQEYTRYNHDPDNPASISSDAIYDIFSDARERIWLCHIGGGMSMFDPERETIKSFLHDPQNINSLSSNNTYRIMQSSSGEYWIGNEGVGLTVFNEEEGVFRHFREDKCNENSLSSDRIRFIFEDSNGIKWIGNETGVDKMLENKNFRTFRHVPEDPNSLNARIVRSIYQDYRGDIWIGSFDVFVTKYNPDSKRYQKQGPVQSAIGLDGVTSMIEDDNLNLWFGTSRGIYVFDSEKQLVNRFMEEPGNPGSISDNTIQIIRKGVDGDIWVGTENGLNLYDQANNQWTSFLHNPEDPHSISSDKIQPNALVIEEDGTVWIGTWGGGLNRFNPQSGVFTRFKNQPDQPNSLSNNSVLAICKTQDGMIWLGTFGGGLNKFNRNDETFTVFTEVDGLANNIVFSIMEDENGYLWIATDNGLSKFDPVEEVFLNFDINDGLPSNQFFWGASFKSQSGELFFGTTDGLLSFYPENIELNKRIPVIKITEFKKYNEPVKLDKSVAYSDMVEVNFNETNFQIEFAALDYTEPRKNQFAYMIEGKDNQWIYIGQRNFISFTNMAPGNYELRVKASNNDNFWNEEGVSLRIIVHPPYWQTWWFRTLFLIAVAAGLWFFYRQRTRKIKQQKKALESLVIKRTSELANSNESLKSVNTKLQVQSEALKTANSDLNHQKEELQVINEELKNQREELASTLDTLKSTQEQLIQSEKMASLGVLSAGVAHEINNPLNFINGAVLGIEEYFDDNLQDRKAEIAPLLNIVSEGIKRVSGIVTSLNHYSRKDDYKRVPSNIHSIIDNCLLMLSNQTGELIEIEKRYCRQDLTVLCSEGKMHQALLNVLTNSVHSIEKSGKITISTFEDKNHFTVSISDTGIGMSRDIIPKITDPFFTTKDPGKGTGLGLSITQSIIHEHKGSIKFQSHKGEGTTVTIVLPLK